MVVKFNHNADNLLEALGVGEDFIDYAKKLAKNCNELREKVIKGDEQAILALAVTITYAMEKWARDDYFVNFVLSLFINTYNLKKSKFIEDLYKSIKNMSEEERKKLINKLALVMNIYTISRLTSSLVT
jgi:hypothetical protein